MVGVNFFGLPRGRVVVLFTFTIEIRPLMLSLKFLVCFSFRAIVVYYNGWLYLYDGLFHLWYCTLSHGSKRDDVIYFYKLYSFSLSYLVTCTVDDCAF